MNGVETAFIALGLVAAIDLAIGRVVVLIVVVVVCGCCLKPIKPFSTRSVTDAAGRSTSEMHLHFGAHRPHHSNLQCCKQHGRPQRLYSRCAPWF